MHALLEFLQDIGSNVVEFFNIRQQTSVARPETEADEGDDAAPPDPRP